jgi:hypothetical protein
MNKILNGVLTAGMLCLGLACGGVPSAGAADLGAPAQRIIPQQIAQDTLPPNQPPDARISFSGGEVALGIGYSWGNGTISFNGMQRPFHIKGLSIANVGVTSITANGEVYNLRRVEDFAGNYAAVAAGATVGGGASVTYLRNQNGVVIKIIATTAGLDFQLSGNGVGITLD